MAAPLAPRGAALKRPDPGGALGTPKRAAPGEATLALEHPDPAEVLAAFELSRRPGVGAASFKRLLALHLTPRRALAALDAAAGGGETAGAGAAGEAAGAGAAGGASETAGAGAANDARVAGGVSKPKGARPKATLGEGLARTRAFLDAGGYVTYPGAPGYPATLCDLGEPPPLLFVRGRPEVLAGPLVAIVGSREADGGALAEARALARACAAAGVGVVSGGAAGIDAAAHEGALEADGLTVALLGCGVDIVYPPGHDALFARILGCGALASELLPGTEPRASFFPTRNRLVAGLARATIVVRGGAKSGALYTAHWARRLGRPLFVLRTRPGDPLGEANRRLAAEGATELEGPDALAGWLARGPFKAP
ncbi:MAG TPA: DNA-processing protein DprA [Polyangiaceae bacterium]|nr:DNA-processing protein DprA [Polyangiaceae bacterium]